jgi:hypothetical protein
LSAITDEVLAKAFETARDELVAEADDFRQFIRDRRV